MTRINAPIDVEQLAVMLGACAGWTFGDAAIWYPEVDPSVTGTLAVIFPVDESRTRYAEGTIPIPGGSLRIIIYRDDTTGAVETLARTLQRQLLTLSTGLVLRVARVGACAEAGPARVAGGQTRKAIDISIEYGLNT